MTIRTTAMERFTKIKGRVHRPLFPSLTFLEFLKAISLTVNNCCVDGLAGEGSVINSKRMFDLFHGLTPSQPS